MKKYNVKVNGISYSVEIELADNSVENNEIVKENNQVNASDAANTDNVLNAPMPGTILGVNVSVGQQVQKGDVLFILEAMKMENEISSPVAGKIATINVKKGDAVESGTLLCSFN